MFNFQPTKKSAVDLTIATAYPILNNMLGDDEGQMLNILNLILDGLSADLDKLAHAIETKDRELVADTLHRMRSNLGLIKLEEQIALMPRSRDENLWSVLPLFMESLRKELESQNQIKAMLWVA